jgi:hypothetical protein
MVSTVKVDVVAPRVATGTTTLGVSGDKLVIPSGVTLTNSGTASGFASGFHQQLVYTASTSAGGYSPATDVTKIMVEILGAGGGGSQKSGDGPKVNSGAAGGYVRKTLTVVSTDTMTVTIGASGAAGGASAAGSAGGSTSFATASGTSFTTLTAGGGGGGTISNYTPGTSGTASGGDLNIIGQGGRTQNAGSAQGGNSMYGFGGSARTNEITSIPAAGEGYGSGGGGGADAAYGGAGAAGLCIITEYK